MFNRFAVCALVAIVTLAITPTATVAQSSVTPVTAAAPAGILVPGGTPVSVSLAEPVSSGSANQGDTVAIVVGKEVDVNGFAIITAGAHGQATVTSVERAGGNGHGGKLAINLDWVYSVDGGKIALSTVSHNSDDGSDKKGAASTATIATYLLLGPLGLFAHNFVHGKDVTLGTDKVYNVFVDQNVHVISTQRAAPAAGFDH